MGVFDLDSFLRKENEIEVLQKKLKKNVVPEYMLKYVKDNNIPVKKEFEMTKKMIFKKGDIYISKHERYAPMPIHNHDFIEINYMYSGKCTEIIQGKEITLNSGELCILDKNIYHSIKPLGKDDILINILINTEFINTGILEQMAKDRSIVCEFLMFAAQEGKSHDQFLVVHCSEDNKIQRIINNVLEEYYNNSLYSMEIIKLSLPILFISIVRNLNENVYLYRKGGSEAIIQALSIIEKEYRTITLGELAKKLLFNKNYLSNLLKKETGYTFSQLVLKQKMLKAHSLVLDTNYNIEEIAYMVGISSTSYLFKAFKKQFGKNPGELRKKGNL